MEWLKNLSNAIEYIEENLDQDIAYDEAARIACCSTFYFQRIFSYVVGIPLSDYIRFRRMTQAAFALQRTKEKVVDVALKYGYASPTSFNRAFQSVHGISPAAAKNVGCVLNVYPAIKFSVTVTGRNAMSYHIEQKEKMRIVGIRTPLVEDMAENQRIIPLFWQNTLQSSVFKEICRLSNQPPPGILGVSIYQNSQDIYYYIAVSTDKPVPAGMYECTISASAWAVFAHDGYFKENVQSVFSRFYTDWLPFSGYTYARLPDIELYPIHEGESKSGYTEVWMAIKKEKEG